MYISVYTLQCWWWTDIYCFPTFYILSNLIFYDACVCRWILDNTNLCLREQRLCRVKFSSALLIISVRNFPLTQCFIIYLLGREQTKAEEHDYGDKNMKQSDFALQQALDQITSAFGEESIMWLNHAYGHKEVPVISTGSFALDTALGIGGLPKVSC